MIRGSPRARYAFKDRAYLTFYCQKGPLRPKVHAVCFSVRRNSVRSYILYWKQIWKRCLVCLDISSNATNLSSFKSPRIESGAAVEISRFASAPFPTWYKLIIYPSIHTRSPNINDTKNIRLSRLSAGRLPSPRRSHGSIV